MSFVQSPSSLRGGRLPFRWTLASRVALAALRGAGSRTATWLVGPPAATGEHDPDVPAAPEADRFLASLHAAKRDPARRSPGRDTLRYHFTRNLDSRFDDVIVRITEVLGRYGFGVLTTVDVRAPEKRTKIDAGFRPQEILGTCSSASAGGRLQHAGRPDVILPCRIVVESNVDGRTAVSAVDPLVSMSAVGDPGVGELAMEVRERLRQVIRDL